MFVAVGLLVGGVGCSIRQLAIKQLGSALAESAGGAFAAESDVEFAGEAIPFSLKLIESLLYEQPDNPELLLAAASGFTQYAYVWVQQPADFTEGDDFAEAQRQRARAREFYLRAHRYAMHGLEVQRPAIAAAFGLEPRQALAAARTDDVPLIYWAAASLGSAITLGKTEPELVARQTQFAALVERAYALDPDWDEGSVRELMISYELARVGGGEEAVQRARAEFARVLELSQQRKASPLVTLAESLCVQEQNRREFTELLNRVLALDPDRHPQYRLANTVMQQRARWLLNRVDELFLE